MKEINDMGIKRREQILIYYFTVWAYTVELFFRLIKQLHISINYNT